MFQLLFKNSIRHLKRNKLFTFLNILGLTIGISSCWVIFKYVSYELSYERGLQDKDNIYRIVSRLNFGGSEGDVWNGGVSRPIFFALRDEVHSLERAVPVYKFYTQLVTIPESNSQTKRVEELEYENQIIETENSYFDMVDYKWLAGNKSGALSSASQVVLTEDRAKFYFPNMEYKDILGKTIIYSDTIQKTVSGVIEALNYPSEFNGEEFILLQKRDRDNQLTEWTNTNSSDRIYLQAKDQKQANNAFNQINNIVDIKYQEFLKEVKPQFKWSRKLELLPLSESHFSTYIDEFNSPKTSKNVLYGLIAVSIFLLVLACINYINLTTAQIPQRAKEIGIRKTLGSTKNSIIFQMMLETSIIILISLIASIFVSKLGIGMLGDLVSQGAKNFNNPLIFGGFILSVLLFTLITAGLYPAWLITRVNAIEIFRYKGNINTEHGNFNLRKSLIVLQFIIAQVFIVAAIIIGQQLQFTVKKDLGFNKDAVVIIDIPYRLNSTDNFDIKKQTLATELRKISGVKDLTLGQAPLSQSVSSSAMPLKQAGDTEPTIVQIFRKTVDSNYINFYKLKLLAGKNLAASDTCNSYIINESAMKAYGFKKPDDAIGKVIGQNGFDFPIVGVIQDFHARDFYQKIEPLVLLSDNQGRNTYNIRLNELDNKNVHQVIESIKSKWSEFFPVEKFDYKFYDESILALYKKEEQLQKITNISTGIAILLSCLGLFGLATITAFQRTKEIGIRKVLGASITGIVGLLSKDFVKMVLIAILIASPIVWWACNKWLEDFIYRIEISWFPFVFGGLIAIVAAMLTVSYQAIKAAKVNPVESLRDE